MNYFISALKNFSDFNGRARRSEYWYFALFAFLINFAIGFIFGYLGMPIIGTILGLVLIIPNIAAAIRRMHDVGKSGWYCLIPIYNLILAFTEGEKGPNQYGPDPKA